MPNHKTKVLIVVDMQHLFQAANDPTTIANCQRLINNAISRQEFIIFLEFFRWGKTLPELTSIIPKDYKFCVTVAKFMDDGSSYVWDLLENNMALQEKDITVCGVNLNACVESTVIGLEEKIAANELPTKIHLVSNACNSNMGHAYKEKTLLRLKEYANVTTVAAYVKANKSPYDLAEQAPQNNIGNVKQALAA